MESNGLRQADLVDVFGAESTVSEVLSGKRDPAKSLIGKLSLRFRVRLGGLEAGAGGSLGQAAPHHPARIWALPIFGRAQSTTGLRFQSLRSGCRVANP